VMSWTYTKSGSAARGSARGKVFAW
jgi:hypothetical protein